MKRKKLRLKKGVKQLLLIVLLNVITCSCLINLANESKQDINNCISQGYSANWCQKQLWN